MLECRLQVQVPLALLGTCSSVAGLISRVAPALCSTSSPAWKCQRGTEGRACPVRPHLDEPWGTCGSYQQPRTCTATTMGGHVCMCVCGCWEGVDTKPPQRPHTVSTLQLLLDVWRSAFLFFTRQKNKSWQFEVCCVGVPLYLQWRLPKVLLDKRSGQQPPPISGPIFWSTLAAAFHKTRGGGGVWNGTSFVRQNDHEFLY